MATQRPIMLQPVGRQQSSANASTVAHATVPATATSTAPTTASTTAPTAPTIASPTAPTTASTATLPIAPPTAPPTVPPTAPATAPAASPVASSISTLTSRPWTFTDHVRYGTKPTVAFLVYALTLYVAAAAPTKDTLLGRVSAPLGNWFIVMLAKSGDIAFGFAVNDAIDGMTWRRMKERIKINEGEKFIGIRLDWFLALMSSTGVEGLLRILFRRRRTGWRKNSAGRWAFIRLAFIMALVPGPGIILTSNIKQRSVFFPVRTLDISGGLAAFDPSVAPASGTVLGPNIARYVQTMLQDRSVTWPVEPINKDCQKAKGCESYLIAGPYQVISPVPFAVKEDVIDSYRIYDAPFVQVDLWYPPTSLTFSASRDCTLYGGLNGTSDYSLILCIMEKSTDDRLVAGWRSCQAGYAANGTCLWPGAPDDPQGWSNYLAFYHRKATVTFSLSQFLIQDVSLNPSHTPYPINATSLFVAINSILYRPRLTTNDPRFDKKSMQYTLTQNIGSMLWTSLYPNFVNLRVNQNLLRNLLTMPVYLFQPTMTAFANQLVVNKDSNGTVPQPNLPLENYVKGAYCTVSNRSIPSWGTVLAYAIVAGVVLIFVGSAKLVAGCLWPPIETSEYPMLDFDVLTRLENEDGNEVELRRLFSGGYEQSQVLDKVKDLRVGLR